MDKNICILGAAGTGKSYLINQYVKNIPATLVAPTGIAAKNIGGQTIHSMFGISPATCTAQDYMLVIKNKHRKVWCGIKTLVIDEIGMLSADFFDLLEEAARLVRGNEEPFGGIHLICVGDFLQLAPVRGDMCFQAKGWSKCFGDNIRVMKKQYRQTNPEFMGLLNRTRVGEITTTDLSLLYATHNRHLDSSVTISIYCTNVDVNSMNSAKLNALGTRIQTYFCVEDAELTVELAVGARVVHTINQNGLVNGSMGTVVETRDLSVVVKWDDDGVCRVVNRVSRKFNDVTMLYLPLKLAWASTVHRVQGMTLDRGILYLDKSFAPGQVYTALSRFRTLDNVCIKSFAPNKIIVSSEAIAYMRSLSEASPREAEDEM